MSAFEPSQYSAASSPPAGAVARLQPGSNTRVFELRNWRRLSHPKRLEVMARIGREAAADPRLRRLAVQIFREAGVEPQDYRGQAAAIRDYVQKHVYFLNEKDEVLQDPAYTLDLQPDGTVGPRAHGDCDDFCTLLIALFEAIHLPCLPVISGRRPNGELVRYVLGDKRAPKAAYSHAYNAVAPHPFRTPKHSSAWQFADATVKGAALGWDVVGQGISDPQREVRRSRGLSGMLGDPGDVEIEGFAPRTMASLVVVGVVVSLTTDLVRAWLKRL